MTFKESKEVKVNVKYFETALKHPVTGEKVVFKGHSIESIKEKIDKKFGTEEES